MTSKPFRIGLLVLGVLTGVAVAVLFHLDNRRLRVRLAQQEQRSEQIARARKEHKRAQDILVRSRASEADGARALHEEVVRARAEVVALEKQAGERRAQQSTQAAADAAAFAANRDPMQAVTKLEYFQEIGAGTPAAALQTFIAASFKGDEAKLARMVVVSESGRLRAEQLIATLPEAARAAWTAEKLGLQFFTGVFAEVPAAQIVGDRMDGARDATVELRLYGKADVKVSQPMQLGPNGWQVVITDKNIAAVQKRMRALAEREPPGKK
jgi:hypothetical protein